MTNLTPHSRECQLPNISQRIDKILQAAGLDGSQTENSDLQPAATTPPPIVGIKLKSTTTEILRAAGEYHGGGTRGQITEISMASIKNATEVLTNAPVELNSIVVLTYGHNYPVDGRIVKCHLTRLRQAIERRFGDFDYFLAIEYQKRGAPHVHMALSFDLRTMGDVVTLKRKKSGRRAPTFQTVKNAQDWLFQTWIDIIDQENPRHNGVRLDWPGLSTDDLTAMHKAFFEYNAGVSWEVMRDRDGGKKYMVKELSGLKGYQKNVPEDFDHPGRHFLYSDSMRFPDTDAIQFALNEAEIRDVFEAIDHPYMPPENHPLYKRMWNSAPQVAAALVERGYRPVSNSTIEAMRKFSELRQSYLADRNDELRRRLAEMAMLDAELASLKHYQKTHFRIAKDTEYHGQVLYARPPPHDDGEIFEFEPDIDWPDELIEPSPPEIEQLELM